MQPAQSKNALIQPQRGGVVSDLSFSRPGYLVVVASGLLISLPL